MNGCRWDDDYAQQCRGQKLGAGHSVPSSEFPDQMELSLAGQLWAQVPKAHT